MPLCVLIQDFAEKLPPPEKVWDATLDRLREDRATAHLDMSSGIVEIKSVLANDYNYSIAFDPDQVTIIEGKPRGTAISFYQPIQQQWKNAYIPGVPLSIFNAIQCTANRLWKCREAITEPVEPVSMKAHNLPPYDRLSVLFYPQTGLVSLRISDKLKFLMDPAIATFADHLDTWDDPSARLNPSNGVALKSKFNARGLTKEIFDAIIAEAAQLQAAYSNPILPASQRRGSLANDHADGPKG